MILHAFPFAKSRSELDEENCLRHIAAIAWGQLKTKNNSRSQLFDIEVAVAEGSPTMIVNYNTAPTSAMQQGRRL